jgi:hypothetical protein
MDGHWPEIVKRVKNFGADLWSFAHEVDHIPVPEGLIKIGTLPRDEYSRKSGSARALLGIGSPPISPTPYDSLCRGVPIVMPYKGDTPTPKGWALYKSELVQHGPINMIGKPYVYTYKLGDVDDMAAKLERAYNNLIESYVPPEKKAAFVVDRVHEVLNHDWEGEYRSLRLEMGGHVPQYDAGLVPTCIKSKMCAAFSDYVPDSFYLPGKPRPVKPTN